LVEADLGTLQPGESRSVTLTTTAVKGGRQLNELTATADGGLETSARAVVNILEANVLVKRGGPAKCYLKSEVGFELELFNPGSAPAGTVDVAETLPSGLDFVSATDGGMYDSTTRTVTWRLAALPPNGRQKLGYRVKAVAIGEQADRVVVRAERGQEAKAEGTFLVEGIPALLLEVVDLEDPIEVGNELTYEVRVVNQGSCPCTNIQITASVPDGLQVRDGTGPTGYRTQGSQVIFEPL